MLNSQEGRQHLEKIAQARSKVLEINGQLSALRNRGELAPARQMLDSQLLPAVAVYN